MVLSFVTIFLAAGFVLIFLYDRYNRTDRLIRKIPGPRRWPIVGNSINVVLPLDKLFLYIHAMHKNYGNVSQIHAVHVRTISFINPEDIETILSTTRFNDKRIPYNFLKPWLGQGLLTSQETAMGTSMSESIESVTRKYLKAIDIIGKTIILRLSRVWLHIDSIFKWSNIAKTQAKAIKDLHTFTNKIINERRIFLQENNIKAFEDDESYGQKGKVAMLDLLLEEEKLGAIDVAGIREEVDTFMFEGHDTTGQALCYLLMIIANETTVQDKIYEEMQNIFGDSLSAPTTEELKQMKYLECCIKESLRLYPSVPIIFRYLAKETTIGGYTIPGNSDLYIPIFDLHRRDDIYPDPERFIPERFLPEACAKRHPYAYIPFSAGPRNCIGQKFAMLEMKILVSSLLRRFRLEAVTKPSDLTFMTDILLRTKNESLFVKFFNR